LKRSKQTFGAEITPTERFVRQVYRVVIAITGAYFYISIPVLILIVIAAIGLIFYGFFYVGQIPIQLSIFILLAGFYTLYAVVRSLLMRRKQVDPGEEIGRSDAIYLWQLLDDVARAVDTRPIERVFLTPGTEIGVYERGGWLQRLNGRGERCLTLGLGALPGMNQGELRAIIAHEYGHFNHTDTAGGDLANAVRFNIRTMASNLVRLRTAFWYNPVWLFINGYYRIFLRVTQGASRLQEVQADRYAAAKYGSQNLKSGLEHIIRQQLEFDRQVNLEIANARKERRGLNNLYTLPAVDGDAELEAAFQKVMTSPTSVYDSHPAPVDRLAYLEKVRQPGYDQSDPRPAWDLLPSLSFLQERMTGEIFSRLHARGIDWPIQPGAQTSANPAL
jgi:Zn-dependent protease with chaperone function